MGGHSGGLHSGTSGARANAGAGSAPAKTIAGNYKASPGLRDHLESAKDAGRDGISGGHEKSAFEEKLREIGGHVIEETNILGIDGMKSIRYEVPKKDKAGNPTSEMRTISTPKSVYDKNVISTEEYMRRGLEAANNAATANNGSLSRSWNGTDNNGVKWKGYLDDNGNVSTLYPTI